MTVNKISNAKLASMKRKSAYALPDNPTGSGMSAEKIKDAFWTFALDENDSIVSELHRIVDEANSDIGAKESSANKGVAIADNSTNIVKFPTAKDVADYVQDYAEPGLTKNSAFNKNFETSTSNIKKNGVANVGSLDTIARADHVHPFSDAETFAENERTKANNASYGAIVHQKEMEGYAQKLATVMGSTDITTSTLTTLGEYIDLFDTNYPTTYICDVGASSTANFKTVLNTNFPENSIGAFIVPKVYNNRWNDIALNKHWKVWEVFCVTRYFPRIRRGFLTLYEDVQGNRQYGWTGWTDLTGT